MMAKVYMALFAWLQVALISANTWFISQRSIEASVVCGFLISLVWTINVKRVAFGSWPDRLVYATGACLGTATGIVAAPMIEQLSH